MTTKVPPGNGSLPHRVARLEADLEHLRERVDRAIVRLFVVFAALMLSIVAALVTTIIYR